VGDAYPARKDTMKCSIVGCPGDYEDRKIVHTVRHAGRIVVIENVPAEVCSVCGDVLLRPETVRRLEGMLREAGEPDRTAPVYEYVS
jgi:YgiT-type zinc finger domain-containing protein